MFSTRPATLADFRDFYERPPPNTFRAIVTMRDEEIIGFGGYYLTAFGAYAFSDIKTQSRKDIVRSAHAFADFLRKTPLPVYAPEPPEGTFDDTAMRHFGFVKHGPMYVMEKN